MLNTIKIFFAAFLIAVPTLIVAQDDPELNRRAERAFNEGRDYFAHGMFERAIEQMERVLNRNPDHVPSLYFYGVSNFELARYEEALEAFTAITDQEEFDPLFNDSWLLKGRCFLHLGKPEKAIEPLEKFQKIAEGSRWESTAKEWLSNARFINQAIHEPVEFEPRQVELPVEDHQSIYLPVKSLDGERLVYTVRERGTEYIVSSAKTEDGWSTPIRYSFLEQYPHNAAPSISPDGNMMLLTICNHRDNIGGCDLYLAVRSESTGQWRGPYNLGEQVNSRGWDSQPAFGPDGRTFYFASDRPGGEGGRDIWYSRILSGGNFATPVNAGPEINSPGNEASPFLHKDGRTLFFKSNGHPGMGDYDIFVARKDDDGKWENPVNLGYPINTMAHDGAIFVDSDGLTAYMASDRFQPPEKRGIYRIFSFSLPDYAQASPVTYIQAKVFDALTGKPLKANARIVNLTKDETVYNHILGSAGTMFAVLTTEADYSLNVHKKGYEFVSRRISVEGKATADNPFVINIPLKPLPEEHDTVETSIVLENVLFEFGSHRLDTSSFSELDRLVEYLDAQEEVKVEIHGHTDNIGDPGDNLILSEKRAASVVEYLIEKGIDPERISSRGFGESKPIADNETEEGRALNRRTEMVVVRDNKEN